MIVVHVLDLEGRHFRKIIARCKTDTEIEKLCTIGNNTIHTNQTINNQRQSTTVNEVNDNNQTLYTLLTSKW